LDDPLLARLQAALGDRYRLEHELGKGGMGRVYRAHAPKRGGPVALKVLHPELATELGVERFLREVGITANLSHPHILPLFDSGEADGLPFYVMPLIEGETLRGRLEREGPLPIDDAIAIAGDVAGALAYAHSRGVVHRDIKPENILFSSGHSLVSDFGIARALDAASDGRLTLKGLFPGTPAYMSPEQASDDARIDGRSDIYSLGCVLYEMLVGDVPFPAPTPRAMMARHTIDPPPRIRTVRPNVPMGLEGVVSKALAKVPADRFATGAEFGEALKAKRDSLAGTSNRESVAVLPFANLSGDPSFESLSDGIAEEILIALAQVPSLRVAARTSSFSFRGTAAAIGEIGAKLGVASVLEGSVRKSGNHLRVSARLVNVADSLHLWSEQYDREMTDVFTIQDDIAKAVAKGLGITLAGEALVTPSTTNLDAYELYLQGRYYLAQRGLGLKRALGAFEKAVTLDPDFALAHSGVAESYSILAQYGLVPPLAIRAHAAAAAARALELAPDSAEARTAAGAVSLMCDWDWGRAAAELRRALDLNPRHGTARIWLATLLVFVEGRLEQGVVEATHAVQAEPLAPLLVMQLGMMQLGAGRYEEAAAALRRAAELAPTMFLPLMHLGLLHGHLGRTNEALEALGPAVTASGRHPWTLAALAVSCNAAGKRDDVEAIHDELVARSRREYVQSVMLAVVNACLGRMDRAFELLERACDEHDGILIYSKRYPFFSVLQSDARMQQVYRRVGFPDAP